ncbi:MAG: hypothetical protein R6V06_03135 [Kiritimatiellia bacterium]
MGLVKCNEDLKVLKIKPSYYTIQGIASIFDASMQPAEIDAELECDKTTSLYTFRQKSSEIPLITYWDCSGHPVNENTTTPGQLTVKGVKFKEPVWVDAVTCAIYEIPEDRIAVNENTTVFSDMPVYDGPVYITEKSLVMP